MPLIFNGLKTRFLGGLVIVFFGISLFSCEHGTPDPEKAIAQTLTLQVDSFTRNIDQFQHIVKNGTASEQKLQQLFIQTRLSYKKFEWAAEYFTPSITRFVNGPPVPEIETTGGQVFAPEGLQVVEGILFPTYNDRNKNELLRQIKLLQASSDRYKVYFSQVDILDWQIFDAAKLEVFRILTLGITGFDNPLTLNSINESSLSLNSLRTVLGYFSNQENLGNIRAKLTLAISYLQKNKDFNSFNRAAFITGYGNEITRDITNLELHLPTPIIKYNRLLRQDAKTLFDKNAFNTDAYAPGSLYFISDKKIALGKKLFSDPLLSGNQSRSCASCHQPDNAFTDKLVKNRSFNGTSLLKRNTPTLLNAALQPAQFYDLRAITLEDQAAAVIQNKDEMHGSMKVVIRRLWKDKTYRQLFAAAFPKKNRTGIDTLELTNAIASFVRSLTLLNSRFDDYMRGNKAAMNQPELNGFNLFMGKAKCATCHYMPLFNGTLPPRYMRIETEVIGVPGSRSAKIIDPDMGGFNILNIPTNKHAFKTTTVRNAALTAPYMHNGIFGNLNEVVDFYNKGGGAGMGIKIDNQTLSIDQLHLTSRETNELVAFIKTLNSK